MADLIDVQNALVTLIAQAIYPDSINGSSAVGVPCMIYPGWPNSIALDADLKLGKCHVSVFPTAQERITTRYSTAAQQVSINAPTLTATVVSQTITITGTPSAPQNIAIIINRKAYCYTIQITDTLTSIATALAALIAVDIVGTTSALGVVTVGATGRIAAARVGTMGMVADEYRRQERVFQMTIWANTPANRDALTGMVDVALTQTNFLTLSDGFAARLTYKGSHVIDSLQKANLYRRDLLYAVEYATTSLQTATAITVETLNVTVNNVTPAPFKTINS